MTADVVVNERLASYRGVEGPSIDDGSEVVGEHEGLVFGEHVAVDIFEYALQQRAGVETALEQLVEETIKLSSVVEGCVDYPSN